MNKNKEEKEEIKNPFFKKVWYSITKLDKYSELSAEGLKRALYYLMTLIAIMAIVITIITVFTTNKQIRNIAKYIDEKLPELSYKNGILSVDSENPIIEENEEFGKIIIDTKTDLETQIIEYTKQIENEETAIILLKNKLIFKQAGVSGNVSYNYQELTDQLEIKEFDKQGLIELLTSKKVLSMYLNLATFVFMYSFVLYLTNTLLNILAISLIGYIAIKLLKLNIKYVSVFAMALYSITLPTILQIIYMIVNTLFNFTINYFDIMYVLIASIYTMAAIFILKTEFNKKQAEVQKIIEVEEQIKEENKKNEDKKETKEPEENKEVEKDKKEDNQENKEDKKEEKSLDGEEPEEA